VDQVPGGGWQVGPGGGCQVVGGWMDADVYVLSYQFAIQLPYTTNYKLHCIAIHSVYYSVYYTVTLQSNYTLQSNSTGFFSCNIFGSVKILRSLKYYSLAMVLAENSRKL